MKQYLKAVVDSLIAPKPTFNTQIFSPSRIYRKQKMLRQCLKFWKYQNEDQLDNDIAKTYYQLREALQDRDEALVLRNTSIDLYQQFKEDPEAFNMEDKISDIVILDCTKSKSETENAEWFQLCVTIKHFNFARSYALQRKVYIDNFKNQPVTPRTWYFIDLPLKNTRKIE